MHRVLTERFQWDPSKIILFSCSETIRPRNMLRDPYVIHSDYSGPCNNVHNLFSVLHGEIGHCTSPSPADLEHSKHVMPCFQKDGGGPGNEPDQTFKPTSQCGCARCKEEKRIVPGEKILLYIRGHGGRELEQDKRQITFVELYTHRDADPHVELFLFSEMMIHDLLWKIVKG